MSVLRINPSELPMQASKWLKSQVLIDAEEMASLFSALGSFEIFQIACVTPLGHGSISKEEFLRIYQNYVESLKEGKLPDEAATRYIFSSVFTVAADHLFAIPVGDTQQLIRIAKPVVQLQKHRLDYSNVDGKFYSMSFGIDSISWGIQFSFPQLYEEPHTHTVHKVGLTSQFPNSLLFQMIQRWIRNNTIPTPFEVQGKQINVPVRLGRNCLSWINQHPQLIKKNIQIKT